MNRQRIGQILFWLGVTGLLINYVVQWIRRPIYVANTAAELSGTFWDPNAVQIPIMGQSALFGLGLSIIGALLYSGKKGSRFWLWGLVPLFACILGIQIYLHLQIYRYPVLEAFLSL